MSDDARSAFPIEPWLVRECGFDLGRLARTESLFACSNGHLGVRGTLDEGAPVAGRGTYLNGFHRTCPLDYPEDGYGYPTASQEIVHVTDGTVIRLLVDDEPLDLRTGQVLHHERRLDLRAGTLIRELTWRSPSGQLIQLRSTRLVSLTCPAVLVQRYEVEPIEGPARIALASELVANQPVGEVEPDPGGGTEPPTFLRREWHSAGGARAGLVHRLDNGLRMAAIADHRIECPAPTSTDTSLEGDRATTSITAELAAGESLSVVKTVAYGWTSTGSPEAVRDQTEADLDAALDQGWSGLHAAQRCYLDGFWSGADVEVGGDPAVQQGVRFGLFQVLQASARADGRPLPAKGLTGPGYSGHAFWDTESFVLPLLTATAPHAAAAALGWRFTTLPLARQRAATLRLRGASFPWRTIAGEECGPYWPAGTAAFHVNAAVAVAAARHVAWTGDERFDREVALPILVETARLWMSLGYLGPDEEFHLDGVTGPDEYSALKNDNTYTNLMAARNLRAAADAARRWESAARAQLQVSAEEVDGWSDAADRMAIPYPNGSGVPEQHRGASREQSWDFAESARRHRYPLEEHHHYVELYRKQVRKQADLVLALHWCGDRFTREQKVAAFAQAEEVTVRDSSLSASAQAVVAAEVGHLELAHRYLREAALTDLGDWRQDTGDGLHLASLAGAWIALVCGFGGLRDHDARLSFAPRLPETLTSIRFTVGWRGHRLTVRITPDTARYSLQLGNELSLEHHGRQLVVRAGHDVEVPLPPPPAAGDPPRQPVDRAPRLLDP